MTPTKQLRKGGGKKRINQLQDGICSREKKEQANMKITNTKIKQVQTSTTAQMF